jgi:hypothetical protein
MDAKPWSVKVCLASHVRGSCDEGSRTIRRAVNNRKIRRLGLLKRMIS